MAATRRDKTRTTTATQSAVDALNTLPGNIQVNLTRYTDGSWDCELSQKVGRSAWTGLPYNGEGRTANEAAAALLAQYHGAAERVRINHALTQTDGDKKAAAALLGISRKTLYRRIETLAQI